MAHRARAEMCADALWRKDQGMRQRGPLVAPRGAAQKIPPLRFGRLLLPGQACPLKPPRFYDWP